METGRQTGCHPQSSVGFLQQDKQGLMVRTNIKGEKRLFLGGKYMRVTVETSFRVSLKKYIHQKSAVVTWFFTYFFLFYILYVYKKLFCNLKILLST